MNQFRPQNFFKTVSNPNIFCNFKERELILANDSLAISSLSHNYVVIKTSKTKFIEIAPERILNYLKIKDISYYNF